MKKLVIERTNIWFWAACVLAILLLASITYICVSKYAVARQAEKDEIFKKGVLAGYEQAVIQLMGQASNCQSVNLLTKNQTMQLVDAECPRSQGIS